MKMKSNKSANANANVEFLMSAAGQHKPTKVFYHACECHTTGYYHCKESNKLVGCWKDGSNWVSDDGSKTWNENDPDYEYEKYEEDKTAPIKIEFISSEDIPNMKQGLYINEEGNVDFAMVINFQ